MTQIWVNLIAQQGLYYQDSEGSYNLTVNYEIQYQKVVSGTPTGSIYTNSGSPFLTIGSSISEPVLTVKKSNNVDGAVLQARNQFSLAEIGRAHV